MARGTVRQTFSCHTSLPYRSTGKGLRARPEISRLKAGTTGSPSSAYTGITMPPPTSRPSTYRALALGADERAIGVIAG
ncbi:hypothetical protein, partial [Streptomyces formicae]